jgi:secreted trypsin-like serine protease
VQAQERITRACTDSDIEFRGQRYRDRVCDSAYYSINGYRLRPGQAPWQALLWRPARLNDMTLSGADRVLCGGALIAQGWILTAAHCLIDQGRSVAGRDYRIRLGVYNPRATEGISYPIQQIFPHPDFDPETYAFDIALVQYDPRRAQQEGPVNSIARIALDPQGVAQRTITETMDVFAYGWGWTVARGGQTTDHLRGVKMQLETRSACSRITGFTGLRQDAALCAGGDDGEQACKGDSGGALVYYGDRDKVAKVIGVVSSGRKCGTRGEPSRYTRVAKVRGWIDGILAANGAR